MGLLGLGRSKSRGEGPAVMYVLYNTQQQNRLEETLNEKFGEVPIHLVDRLRVLFQGEILL